MTKRILHAGCGGENLPPWFPVKGEEVKLDIDERLKPDIVASIDNMGDIGEFDALYCCHCLEHLQWFRAMTALREFYRVLKPGGIAFAHVPNLDGIPPDDTVIYTTSEGLQITGLDMYYGYRAFSFDNPYMLHGCGFVPHTMYKALKAAGFEKSGVVVSGFDLIGIGIKPE